MTDELDVAGWIEAYARAWRDKDAAAVATLFTEDARYLSHPLEQPHIGRAGISAYWERATRTQRDLDLRFGSPLRDGLRVAVEWWARMRDDEWEAAAGGAAGGEVGGGVTLPGCLLLTFTPEGLCARLREYYNPGFGERLPAPPGWGR